MKEILFEIKQNVLGPLSIGYYASAFFFSFIGLLIMLYYRSTTRDKNSKRTPVNFSFWFLVWDNAKRMVTGLLVMYVLFRFASEFFSSPLSMRVALGIGFAISLGLEPMMKFLVDRSEVLSRLMEMPRDKYMEKLTEKAKGELSNHV